mgnify:FL=1
MFNWFFVVYLSGIMYVDDEGPFTGSTTGTFQGLDLVEPLYVGGVSNFNNIHRSVGYTKGLVGKFNAGNVFRR